MTGFTLAGPDDDAVLRALLRDNAMPSWVAMSIAREPDYFAGANRFGRDWAVIARREGEPVGMYACSEQAVFLNGAPAEIGYLGALRITPGYRNRLSILRGGYASLREFAPPGNPGFWYTAIAEENRAARRILEANLRGMPNYRPLNRLVTLALPRARAKRHDLWQPVQPEGMAGWCEFHNRHARQYQFAPLLTPAGAATSGASYFAVERHGEPLACMALWNQQSYKQIVASAYRNPLGALLPAYNAYARLTRRVSLPRVGEALDLAYLAFLAVSPPLEPQLTALLEDALSLNTTTVLSLGLHDSHPQLARLTRTFRPAIYRTWIYTVDFGTPLNLDGRAAQPEVAVL